jgi:hypothetical protein
MTVLNFFAPNPHGGFVGPYISKDTSHDGLWSTSRMVVTRDLAVMGLVSFDNVHRVCLSLPDSEGINTVDSAHGSPQYGRCSMHL